MGVEYRMETYDVERAEVAARLRNRGFHIEQRAGRVAVRESTSTEGMPAVELVCDGGSVMLVVHEGSPAFTERLVGAVMIALSEANDQVVLSQR